MSTRRARIKAVTSLPPRRKNAGAAEKKVKDPAENEKSTKSPQDPLDDMSPRNKNYDTQSHENIVEKIIITEKPPSSSVTTVDSASKESTPIFLRTPEKVHSIESKKNASDVFASPARKDSPKKTFASPLAPSPKVSKNTDLPRPPTPQNRPTPTSHKFSDNNELQIAEKIVSKIDHNITSSKDNANDYNIPSVTESTDDEAMDGIIPLKPAASVPKPLDVLKNAIISENAEVLFDPIVPLPSPSKVRPKLRPVPRLGPHRRNSVQGSASESEDETRRGLLHSKDRQTQDVHTLQSLPNRDVSRVRNDSVCSSVGPTPTQSAAPASPARDKTQISKARRQEECRRRMASRRRREHTKRDALTMYDLIFYNPTSNPLVLTEDEIKLKEAREKQEAESKKETSTKAPEPQKKSEAAPVPQIKLGPKGEIILDEQSLVIKQTESDRRVSSVVHEGAWGPGGEYKKQNCNRAAGWPAPETVRFYRALAALGTDFTLMAQLFPGRTRKHLKMKFKKEEKVNGAQIDKALRATLQFDVAQLRQEFEEERAAAARQAQQERERLAALKLAEKNRMKAAREQHVKRSRGARAMEADNRNVAENPLNFDEVIRIHMERKRARRSAPQTTPQAPKVAIPRENITREKTPNTTPQVKTPDAINALKLPNREKTPNTTPQVKTPDAINALKLPNREKTPNTTPQFKTPDAISALKLPSDIETGSLVVLTVNDPSTPAKKMLQAYIAKSPGQLTPVALPSHLLNYVVGYMKKGTATASSPILSPGSVTSVESNSGSSGAVLPSPNKRQRQSSFTITQL